MKRDPDAPHCVYAVYEDGEIIYIGFSRKPEQRLRGHIATKICSKHAELHIIGWYSSILKARQYEEYYIGKFRPVRNKWGKRLARAKARRIWFSRPRMSNKEIVVRMPGWTFWSAYSAFGSRP